MKIMLSALAAAVPALASAATIQAAQTAQPVQLASNVMLERVIVQGGQEKIELKKPEVVLPGDRLLFETSFRNSGGALVQRFVVTNPVPSGVAFSGQSSAGAEVSVDGGRTWGQLAQLKVRAGAATRAARASDVTHVRWTLATIAPGAAGSLRYRGFVR